MKSILALAALAALQACSAQTLVPRCKLGGVVDISCVVLGTLHLHEAGNASAVLQKINAALAVGITTWDLSDVYNSMPGLFGAALQLQPGLRAQLQVIAKMDIVSAWPNSYGFDSGASYDTSPDHLNAVLGTYLTAMGTNYVDVVLLHRQDYLLDIPELASTVQAWVSAGKVKAFGGSNFDQATFNAVAKSLPLVANEIELSVLRPTPFVDGTVSFHYGQGSSVLAWGPLGGDPWGGANRLFGVGSLDGTQRPARIRAGLATVAAALNTTADVAAVAWLLRHPSGIIPIIGTMDPVRMQAQSVGAIAVGAVMTRPQWYHIADAAGMPIY